MSAFPITFVVSACLLAIFIIYFARTHSGQRKRGVDQESLLPLEEETPRVVGGSRSNDGRQTREDQQRRGDQQTRGDRQEREDQQTREDQQKRDDRQARGSRR